MANVRIAGSEEAILKQLKNTLEELYDYFGVNSGTYKQLMIDLSIIRDFLNGNRALNTEQLIQFLKERWERVKDDFPLLRYTLKKPDVLNQEAGHIYRICEINELFVALAKKIASRMRDDISINERQAVENHFRRLVAEKRQAEFVAKKHEEVKNAALAIITSNKSVQEKQADAMRWVQSEALAEQLATATDLSNELDNALKQNIQRKIIQLDQAKKRRENVGPLQAYDIELANVDLIREQLEQLHSLAIAAVAEQTLEKGSQICAYQLLMPSVKNTTTMHQEPLDDQPLSALMLDEYKEHLLLRCELLENITKHNNRNHPFSPVNRQLTDNEMDEMRQNRQVKQELEAYETEQQLNTGYITTRSLRKIKKFIEGIMLSNGDRRMYSRAETKKAAAAIGKFRDYLESLDPIERKYIEYYNIFRSDQSASKTFINVMQDQLGNNVCSFESAKWFCKFLYDHDPKVTFSSWTIGGNYQYLIGLWKANDAPKKFNPRERVIDVKPTYLVKEKEPGIKGFIKRNWKKTLLFGGITLLAGVVVASAVLTFGISLPVVTAIGATLLFGATATSTVTSIVGFAALTAAATLLVTGLSAAITEAKTPFLKVYPKILPCDANGAGTKDIRKSLNSPPTLGTMPSDQKDKQPRKETDGSDFTRYRAASGMEMDFVSRIPAL